MNKVEIEVTSTDRTNFSAIAAKAKTEMNRSVGDGLRNVEKTSVSRFRQIGDKSGKELSHGIEDGTKDVEKVAKETFKGVEGAGKEASKSIFSSFSSAREAITGPAAIGGVVLALHALPAVAAVAAGGITLALGGAIAAIGIKSQLSNAQVQQSFADTKKHVVSSLQDMSTPFQNTLLHMSQDARNTFDELAPHLSNAFSKIAPALTKFSSQFSKSLSSLGPVIDHIGTAFSRLLNSIGSRSPQIMGNLASGIDAIVQAAASNPEAITSVIEDVSELAKVTGQATGFLVRHKNAFGTLWNTMTQGGGITMDLIHLFDGGSKSAKNMGVSVLDAAKDFNGFIYATDIVNLSNTELASTLKASTQAFQGGFDATTQYRQALLQAKDAAAHTNAGINGMGKAAVANRAYLSNLAKTIQNVVVATRPGPEVFNKMYDSLVHVARGMGLSKAAAEQFANSAIGIKRAVDNVPKSHKTVFSENAAQARANTDKFTHTVKSVPNSHHTVFSENAAVTQQHVNSLIHTVNATPAHKSTSFSSNSSAVQARVNSLIHSINSIPRSRTTTITTIYRTVYTSSGSRTFGPGNRHIGDAHGGIVGHAAEGGPRSNTILVGEQGPELVDLPAGSRVHTNPDTRAAIGNAGGGQLDLTLTVVGGDSDTQRFLANMIKKYVRVTAGSGPTSVQTAFGR